MMEPSDQALEPGVLLLDTTSSPDEEFCESFLERNGHPVVACHGPAQVGVCPILGEQGCELFERAHGIIFQLDLDDPQHRRILERYRELNDEIPIRVVVRPEQADRYSALLARFEVLAREPNVADLDGFAAEVEASDRFSQPQG